MHFADPASGAPEGISASAQSFSRRDFLRLGAGVAGALALSQGQVVTAAPRKPNLVLIFSDQQHFQAFGLMDSSFDTPAMNAVASEGTVFENTFCTTPQCSPSRSSMMTGLYPHKTGVIGNIGAAGFGEIAQLGLKTVGVDLKRAGYRTAYFGKWHLGDVPTAREGWDEIWTVPGGDIDPEVTRRGTAFLDSVRDSQPFALVLSYVNPHDIYHFDPNVDSGPRAAMPSTFYTETFAGKPAVQKQFMTEDQGEPIWSKPEETWERYRGLYREKTRMYDEQLGQVVSRLKARGLWESTVLFVTSDHGDMDGNHRLIFKGPFMYEHMVRVPLIARVPSAFGGQTRRIRDDVVLTDLAPTLADFAGVTRAPCDGFSLKPALTGAGPVRARDFVISQYYGKQRWTNPIRMIRTPHYKYNLYLDNGEELYNLKDDPQELVNLASDSGYRKTCKEMRAQLERWMRENSDPFHLYGLTDREGAPV
ncbi:MAG: sulfatase-like hydrolase/transferase [Armatimonadetes bacterium]|nr:sulfatase-like hydrolase/transferase [Armatimonadota bacterium]